MNNKTKIEKEGRMEIIVKIVCTYFNLDRYQLSQSIRARDIVYPRQVAMYFMREYTKASLQDIARFFYKKSHLTAKYACETIDNILDTDREERERLFYLEKIIFKALNSDTGKSYDIRISYEDKFMTVITRSNFNTSSLIEISHWIQQNNLPKFKLGFI